MKMLHFLWSLIALNQQNQSTYMYYYQSRGKRPQQINVADDIYTRFSPKDIDMKSKSISIETDRIQQLSKSKDLERIQKVCTTCL